jgi:two-component system, cell cycle sensor histidine kinase and response regulator CckA
MTRPGPATTVLVVEDDQETLFMISKTLAAGGHDVLWARDADDALRLLAKREGSIGLILTDVVLPGLSGPELVARAREEHGGIAAIYVSAYDVDAVRAQGVDPERVPFLAKPYEPTELLKLVRETLAGGEQGTGAGGHGAG